MKVRVSSSCTVSRSSGQTAALWESSFCLVASSSTHSPNAKMSTERVYWFLGFVPAGSTSGCRQQHSIKCWHRHSATHAVRSLAPASLREQAWGHHWKTSWMLLSLVELLELASLASAHPIIPDIPPE